MTSLETVRVSLASADQRRGRAGRLGPGVCYRLWPEAETRALAAHDQPEILVSDLTPLVLELAAWGVSDALLPVLARSTACCRLCAGARLAQAFGGFG